MTAINSNRAIRGPVTAVPVVAGKGVRLVADTENNRWVVEADETVLWEDLTYPDATRTNGSTIKLSELPGNFSMIRVYWSRAALNMPTTAVATNLTTEHDMVGNGVDGVDKISGTCTFIDSVDSGYIASTIISGLLTTTATLNGRQSILGSTAVDSNVFLKPYKIVGINRIASN